MKIKYTCLLFLFVSILTPSMTRAAFVVSVDPVDLSFQGPGVHAIDLLIRHEGGGQNTIDGLQIDLTNSSNAVVRQEDVFSEFAASGTFFSASINSGNRLAIGNVGNLSVDGAPGNILARLIFDVADDQDFTIGMNFVTATRSFTPIDTVSESFTVPSTFTVSASAVPEPSTWLAVCVGTGMIAMRRRFIKRREKF